MFGVLIKKGPLPYEIIQQKDGFGSCKLSGRFVPRLEDHSLGFKVFVRVTSEDNGMPVVDWKEAELIDDRHWQLMVDGIPVGGLYRIETCLNDQNLLTLEWATRGDFIHHVGVGEVFVIAGQSNSAGYGRDYVNDPPELGVHLLKNNGLWDVASHPLNDSTGSVHEVNCEAANSAHSPMLNFAKTLKKALGCPIGLVQASLGGSPLARWNPNENGELYKSMLDSMNTLSNKKVRGVLWYQGCSDAGEDTAQSYCQRFLNMVDQWRTDLDCPELAFFTVQLNRLYPETESPNHYWSMVREAQRVAAHHKNVFVVPAIDMTLSDEIHNNAHSNLRIGERLALSALGLFGKTERFKAPDIQKAVLRDANTIDLTFDNVYAGLYGYSSETLYEADKHPFYVTVNENPVSIRRMKFQGNQMSLTLDAAVAQGDQVYVSLGHGQNPTFFMPCDLYNYMPVLCFYRFPVQL